MRWGDAFTSPHYRQRLLYYSELIGTHTFLPHGCALKPRDRAHPHHAAGIPVGCHQASDDPKGLVRMFSSRPVLNSFQKIETFRSGCKCGCDEILSHLNLVALRVYHSEARLFAFRHGSRYRHELTIQRLESKLVWSRINNNTTINSYSTAFKILHRADPPFIFKWDDTIIRALIRSNRYYIICLKMCIFTNSMIPENIITQKRMPAFVSILFIYIKQDISCIIV